MITFRQLKIEVLNLVEASPTFKYDGETCEYVQTEHNNGPCVFGQAFASLGVNLEEHPVAFEPGEWFEEEYPFPFHGYTIDKLLDVLEIEHTEEERMWAKAMQTAQDVGNPWYKCLERADKEYADLMGDNL